MVDVGSHFVSAECTGSGDGPTAVFLHGLGGAGVDWEPTSLLLEGERSCTYDRLNVGGSDTDNGRHTALDSVEELHAFLEQVGEPPFVLAAHSYGGLIAEMYAATYPDEVAGLVLADSTLTLETSLDPPSSVEAVRRDMDANAENLDAYEGYAQARELEPRLPHVPIHYILAERGELPAEWDADAYDRKLRAWIRALPQGTLIRCDCPHEIPMAAPDVLAEQVRAVIAESTRPTGPWLAYQAPGGEGEGDGIFLVQTDGTGTHQILTEVPGEQTHPDWSPTGKELAFIVAEDTQEVWISDADGSHARRVAACTGTCLAYDYAAWMPSGRGLLMMRYDGPATDAGVPASSSLELLELSTGTTRDVTRSAAHELFSAPRVSPDGTSYCVTAETGDVGAGPTGTAIKVGKIAGGPARRVSKPGEWGSYCDWRPTARNQIVYTDHDLGIFADMSVPSNLHTVHADGSHRTQLTRYATGKMRATQPRWTPDGRRILFTAVDGDGSLAYRRMASANPHGRQIRPATGEQWLVGTHPTLQPPG